MNERRYNRAGVSMGCWLVNGDGAECIDVANISEGGMAAETAQELPTGRRVTLQFFTPRSASALTVRADVVWNRFDGARRQAGFHFVDASGEILSSLRELVVLKRRRH